VRSESNVRRWTERAQEIVALSSSLALLFFFAVLYYLDYSIVLYCTVIRSRQRGPTVQYHHILYSAVKRSRFTS